MAQGYPSPEWRQRMNKLICDVCGTSYPETAQQCPICGCVKSGSQGVDTGKETGQKGYTYVKGGRFSKSNVKKRLKASQAQQAAAAEMTRKIQEPAPDDDGYEEDEDAEVGTASNKGLIVVVILLLLAIIAVSAYIWVQFFGPRKVRDKDYSKPTVNAPVDPTTGSNPSETNPNRVPCTGLELSDATIPLSAVGEMWGLGYEFTPLDTTDSVVFRSSDDKVATVDANGCVTAVGSGRATITVSCGEFVRECVVVCDFSQAPTDPSETDPTNPSDSTEPVQELVLKSDDITFNKLGQNYKLYNGTIPVSEITWESENEAVVTVADGVVTAIGNGDTRVFARYQGQEVFCWFRVKAPEAPPVTEPTDPSEPEPTDPSESEPTEPTETEPSETEPTETEPVSPVVELELNRDDFSLFAVGESHQLYSGTIDRSLITWSSSDESVVTVSDGLVVAVSKGHAVITASYDGQVVTCDVHVLIND